MGQSSRIIVVDHDAIVRQSLCGMLADEGYAVEPCAAVDAALDVLARRPAHVVLAEANTPDVDGFELLRVLRDRHPQVVPILTTGYGTIDSAVEAIKLGAFDYLTKPLFDDEVKLVIERALQHQALRLENHALRSALSGRYSLDNIVGSDYRMARVFEFVETVADARITVLLGGESGTGKSMIARAIHHHGPRASEPFVEVACGAVPESLLESELFGHVRGAFTGAHADKVGRFKAADGGTIFLDEIATASPALQVKLLRVLQDRQFEPVGSTVTESVDVRIILATNLDLEAEVAAGRFREDLYYRVNVAGITLPPLRERIGDIPDLARHFLTRCASESGHEKRLSDEALHALQSYPWPGNVRELENVIERAVVFSRRTIIDIADLPPAVRTADAACVPATAGAGVSLQEALAEPEKRIIAAALEAHAWNRQATADALQINRTTLYKKMKRYGLKEGI